MGNVRKIGALSVEIMVRSLVIFLREIFVDLLLFIFFGVSHILLRITVWSVSLSAL